MTCKDVIELSLKLPMNGKWEIETTDNGVSITNLDDIQAHVLIDKLVVKRNEIEGEVDCCDL